MQRFNLFNTQLLLLCTLAWTANAIAQDVNITPELAYVDTVHDGKIVRIERIQDEENMLTGGFTKTSRKCPPFCIRPMKVADGVHTIGEVELLQFIQQHVNNGTGVLIDARTLSWHKRGTIPSSVSIPFTVFTNEDKNDLLLKSELAKLGVRKKTERGFITDLWSTVQELIGKRPKAGADWDFSDAKEVALWCNGMWCGQSPRAIEGLLAIGYPAEKIRYYRGGMQSWQILGLTVVIPKDNQ